MTRTLLAVAVLAACCGTAHAQRWDDAEWRQTTVPIADLDLSTDAGVAELDRRIDRAVDRICDHDRDCRDGAWASTYEQVQAAVARDQWMRRMAAEREAELRACGWRGCRPQAPAYYYPPPPPPAAGVTVITVTTGYQPSLVQVWRQ